MNDDRERSEGTVPVGALDFGDLRRLIPISVVWGFDRGLPIDRYYIERFLQRHAADIRGRVLEVGDNTYTRRFGGDRVTTSDVLNFYQSPGTTIQADLASAPQIPSNTFDCIIVTQTLQLIYDLEAAVSTLYRILRHDGVLLATFPGITHTQDGQWAKHWCWSLTPASAERLFGEAFGPEALQVEGYGNVLAAISFLHGVATEELAAEELDFRYPAFDVTIAVRASKHDDRALHVKTERTGTQNKRALIAGWFSYEGAGTTAGDLMAKDLVQDWLVDAGYDVDVALCKEFNSTLQLSDADPSKYSIAVFVCGPYMPRAWEAAFLGRFAECFVIGVDLSLPVPLAEWNPFDVLFERDSDQMVRPDVTFASTKPLVPVVGVCLVEDYEGARTSEARAAIEQLLQLRAAAVVQIDTRLPTNMYGLRTSEEVESLLARMDLVITTRLHGTVLSLKNGVPVIAIDPEAGGAKIKKQADALGWPAVFTVDDLQLDRLLASFDYCLTSAARSKAQECARKAVKQIEDIRRGFLAAIAASPGPRPKQRVREQFARSHDCPIGRDPQDSK